eukprot:TRINITY_DN1408_c0_g1_i1.p1 TRINITY_DN1408_c0_g1~~TRINITY_DN1408_c0_g1_i1.p1  ORF type:complete len:189 (+),score=60.28 TRINITY_DN1408_c0_g1_i1:332-898(+)
MKTALIINGKQVTMTAKGRLNDSLCDIATKVFEEKGYKVIHSCCTEEYDRKEERAKFAEADIIVYQFPMFWFSCPAPMHQYINDVYKPPAFFKIGNRGVEYGTWGQMTGKKVLLSSTWNALEECFDNKDMPFMHGANMTEVLEHLRRPQIYCGMEMVPEFSCHDVMANPDFEKYAKEYEAHLIKVFEL